MTRAPQPIIIVQGGQFGSEAKGAIAAYICQTEGVDFAVRTGAVNAGHTVYYQPAAGDPGYPTGPTTGAPWHEFKMQQLPTGWVSPGTKLVLGAGALIHPEILFREIDMVARALDISPADFAGRHLVIDHRAGLHLPVHTDRSTASGRHHAIGATGKGCSEALTDRIRQRGNPDYHLFKDWLLNVTDSAPEWASAIQFADTAVLLNEAYDRGDRILLEGTQGTFLDLLHGPYPYTTHKPCLPAQWAVECGLSPALKYEVVLVMRTYPIRVAGNSGPLPAETSWPALAAHINTLRENAGLMPLVAPESIDAFMGALEQALYHTPHPTPTTREIREAGFIGFEDVALSQHLWPDTWRVKYAVLLSELNKAALRQLNPDTVADLSRLFEMTTVTRKLRRVAAWSAADARQSVLLNRPSRVALTFLNYRCPEMWGVEASSPEWTSVMRKAALRCVAEHEDTGGLGRGLVTMFSTGPYPTHIHRI